jgi:hypothetical protein
MEMKKARSTVGEGRRAKEDAPAIMSKAIEMAKAGNVPMLKLLVDRMLPKQRTIEVELSKLQLGSDSGPAGSSA